MKNTLAIFIPCYNESKSIISTILKILEAVQNQVAITYEILIIDDGSKDNSIQIIEDYMDHSTNNKIILHKLEKNRGLGAVYHKAISITESEYFIYIPGDDVISINDLRTLFKNFINYDLTIPYFDDNDNRTFIRLKLSKFFTNLMNIFSGLKIPYFNGPVIAKTYLLKKYFPKLNGFSSQAEFLVRAIYSGATFQFVKINNQERENGDSKALSIKNVILAGYCFFRVIIIRIKLIFVHSN